jgi:hypothetical protein
VPSGKKSRQQRQAAPPPVRSKGGGGTGGTSRRTWVIVAVVVLVLAGIGIGLGVGLSGGSGGSAHTATASDVDFSKITGLQTGAPPWNNGSAYLSENLTTVGLTALTAEGTTIHIHQHLDVYVDGNKVAVPADIGIDPAGGYLTEIHVHDTSGIIHVESPTVRTYYLGQLFGEWTVMLSSNCLGKYCGNLHWWVNGKERTGNPASLPLSQHQEIVIATGTPPAHIPSTFNFAAHGV